MQSPLCGNRDESPVKSELASCTLPWWHSYPVPPTWGGGKESVDGLQLKEGRCQMLARNSGTKVSTGQWRLPWLLDRWAGAGGEWPPLPVPRKALPSCSLV